MTDRFRRNAQTPSVGGHTGSGLVRAGAYGQHPRPGRGAPALREDSGALSPAATDLGRWWLQRAEAGQLGQASVSLGAEHCQALGRRRRLSGGAETLDRRTHLWLAEPVAPTEQGL